MKLYNNSMISVTGISQIPVLTLFLILLLFSMPVEIAIGQDPSMNWDKPAADLQNTNYNPQTAINKDNVDKLVLKWIYQVPEDPYKLSFIAPSLGLQTAPLVVHGIVYLETFYNRVIALNAETGAEVWRYQVNVTEFLDEDWWCGRRDSAGECIWGVLSQKSLLYHDGLIYFMASDCRVIGLDATDGTEKFLIKDVCKDIPGNTGAYFGEHAPIIVDNILIARPSTQDGGGRGFVSAYDLQTKELLWRWFSVPPSGGDPDWDFKDAAKGNIDPFEGDWGTTDYIGGGAVWTLIAADQQTRMIYFSTGSVPGLYDAALRPGPNLYASSIIGLDLDTGELVWYYSVAPHDINDHEVGWSVMLIDANIMGEQKQVVVAGSKTDHVYVLDSMTGVPVYDPIKLTQPAFNVINDNAGNDADLFASQESLVGKSFCPGGNGGIEHPPAFHDNVLFVASQKVCWTVAKGPVDYKGKDLDGFLYSAAPGEKQNSTLFAIDISDGSIKWLFEMPNRYQSSGVTVTGDVVYAVDRASVLYALDADTGELLRRVQWGGLGAGSVTVGATARGEVMLFVPSGGGQIATNTPGIIAAFALPDNGQSDLGLVGNSTETILILVALLTTGIAIYTVIRSRK